MLIVLFWRHGEDDVFDYDDENFNEIGLEFLKEIGLEGKNWRFGVCWEFCYLLHEIN